MFYFWQIFHIVSLSCSMYVFHKSYEFNEIMLSALKSALPTIKSAVPLYIFDNFWYMYNCVRHSCLRRNTVDSIPLWNYWPTRYFTCETIMSMSINNQETPVTEFIDSDFNLGPLEVHSLSPLAPLSRIQLETSSPPPQLKYFQCLGLLLIRPARSYSHS